MRNLTTLVLAGVFAALPVAAGEECSHQHAADGHARPRLGVQIVDTTPELREHLGADRDAGVLVSRVLEDSAAERAGVRVGDLIVSVAGEPVEDGGEIGAALAEHAGETIELGLVRDGRSRSVDVELPQETRREPGTPRAAYAPHAHPPTPPAPPAAPRAPHAPAPPAPPTPAPSDLIIM